jgi:hypothetical protein
VTGVVGGTERGASPNTQRSNSLITREKAADFQGFPQWARLGSNQRPLACEARDHDAFILLIGTICITVRSVHTPCQG